MPRSKFGRSRKSRIEIDGIIGQYRANLVEQLYIVDISIAIEYSR